MGVLSDVKQYLGVDHDDPTFDTDITMHIDAALSVLKQVGGTDSSINCTPDLEWGDVLSGPTYSLGKHVVYLTTRLGFDPPQNSFVTNSLQEQLEEAKTRLVYEREVADA